MSFSVDPRHQNLTATYNATLTGINQTAFLGPSEPSVIHDYLEYKSYAEHSIIHRNNKVEFGDTMNESRMSRLVGTLVHERTYDNQ
jgi:hypothetical protein